MKRARTWSGTLAAMTLALVSGCASLGTQSKAPIQDHVTNKPQTFQAFVETLARTEDDLVLALARMIPTSFRDFTEQDPHRREPAPYEPATRTADEFRLQDGSRLYNITETMSKVDGQTISIGMRVDAGRCFDMKAFAKQHALSRDTPTSHPSPLWKELYLLIRLTPRRVLTLSVDAKTQCVTGINVRNNSRWEFEQRRLNRESR